MSRSMAFIYRMIFIDRFDSMCFFMTLDSLYNTLVLVYNNITSSLASDKFY